MSNLAYKHETGREAALDFVTVLVNKFPDQLVAQWSETVGGAVCRLVGRWVGWWVGGWRGLVVVVCFLLS